MLRCLEFDPGNRYHHAGELLEALRAVIDEPPLEKPDVVYLKEGYDLKNRGNLDSACRAFQRGLDAPPSSRETSFALLWGSGEVLGELGRYNDAVDRLVRAWKLTENTAILRERDKRAQLLGQIAHAYRRIGNEFNTRRYEELRAKELSRK